MRAFQPLHGVGHFEDLQALRSPEKVGTPNLERRSQHTPLTIDCEEAGRSRIHLGQPKPLTWWNKSPQFDGYKNNPEMQAMQRRVEQEHAEEKQAKLLSTPPEEGSHTSHTDFHKKTHLVANAKFRLEAQKVLDEQTTARDQLEKREEDLESARAILGGARCRVTPRRSFHRPATFRSNRRCRFARARQRTVVGNFLGSTSVSRRQRREAANGDR